MALEKFSANDAHLLRFPGCSCGFLRAGRFNGTGLSCPVSISLSTRELSRANPIYSHRYSPVAHLLFAGRVIHQQLLLSVVGPNSQPCSCTVPQSRLLLLWISLTPCRAAALSQAFQQSRSQGKLLPQPGAMGQLQPQHTSPSCLSPWLPGSQERRPVGWDKASKFLSQADRRYSAEEATSP